MNCSNCGAGLPPKSAACPYCGTLNDIDLRGVFDVAARAPAEDRACPQCDGPLETLDVGAGRRFLIERCPRCLGLFFDPGELQAVVATIETPTAVLDLGRLNRILDEETPADGHKIRYRKCPVCRQPMNRHVYGLRSGVVFDRCAEHGAWLDGGELRRIFQWVRSGGKMLEMQRKAEQERAKRDLRVALGRPALTPVDEPLRESLVTALLIAIAIVARILLRM